jgi:hypothetical protein
MRAWMKNRLTKSIVVGAMAVLTVGGLAYAVTGPLGVLSSSSSTVPSVSSNDLSSAAGAAAKCSATGTAAATASETSSASAADCAIGGKGLKALLKRTIHAQLIVRGKSGQWVTVDLDRGKITTISSTSITIKRADGVSVSATITPSTRFRRATESELMTGDPVVLVQVGGDADFVVALHRAASSSGGSGSPSSGAKSSAPAAVA